jgi:hypothetical protein
MSTVAERAAARRAKILAKSNERMSKVVGFSVVRHSPFSKSNFFFLLFILVLVPFFRFLFDRKLKIST